MGEPERWLVEKHGHNWIVVSEDKPEDEDFVADCGQVLDCGESHARRIKTDHNACLRIEDPETTVPELVDVCNRMYVSLANTVKVQENMGIELPLTDKLLQDVHDVLAKTGQKPAASSPDSAG